MITQLVMHCLYVLLLWALVILMLHDSSRLSLGCSSEEKLALLNFKASINETKNSHFLLPSWIGEEGDDPTRDCCTWERVQCTNETGRIVELKLHGLRDYLPKDSKNRTWFLNVTIFLPIKNLRILDLSGNFFQSELQDLMMDNLEVLNLRGTKMKKFSWIQSMTSLKALSLSLTGINDSYTFEGVCKLKNLLEIDLSWNNISGSIPLCISNLTSLRVLDLSNNNFSGNIPELIVTRLIHLEYLSLSGNHFEGSFSLRSLANHSKLQVLKLVPRGNDFHVDTQSLVMPPSFQLRILYLAGCNLNERTGHIPSFLFYQKELRVVDLSSNKLVGKIPVWLLENNTKLEILELKNNFFTGPFRVNGPPKLHLFRLDISNNDVIGEVPPDFGSAFPMLRYLSLSRNSFKGNLPQSLGNLTRAYSIDLSNNNFSGEVPNQIATGCVSLKILALSNNCLQGNFPSSSTNLTSLQVLYLDNNCFSGNVSHGLSYSPDLYVLDISKNEFQGKIPGWLGNFPHLETLGMSGNSFEGSIPDDICKLQWLTFLDLSENKLSGSLPSCSSLPTLRFFHTQKNQITGIISNVFCRSFNLMTIDVRHNQLSGHVPECIVELSQLRVLLLGENKLHGQIPSYICQLENLTIVDLSKNNFSGPIPSCFTNISFGRGHFARDAFFNADAGFALKGNLATYTYHNSLDVDQYIIERFMVSDDQEGVEFTTKSRSDSYAGNILNYMSGLDLSWNQLTGDIPPEFGDLSDIRALNLSNNYLQGSIPPTLSMLHLIESLDLSYNNLTGEIPSDLTNLNFLSIFIVSYNNLSGRTPDKGQFANFDDSNYEGNPGLCGPLLKRSCNSITIDPRNVSLGEKTDGALDMVAFFWSFSMSFAAVLFALFLTLCISPYHRAALFQFIDVWILSCFY